MKGIMRWFIFKSSRFQKIWELLFWLMSLSEKHKLNYGRIYLLILH